MISPVEITKDQLRSALTSIYPWDRILRERDEQLGDEAVDDIWAALQPPVAPKTAKKPASSSKDRSNG